MSPSVAVLFHRIGPYHFARLAAAGTRCELTALELSAVDDTYAWSRVDGASNFKRVTLFCDEDVDRKSGRQVGKSVHAALAAADPQIVAVPGWSRPGALLALLWCVQNGRPAILMSESGRQDAARRSSLETIKRRVARLFSSALMGGAPHRDYACALGLPRETVFTGYDVVGNRHFDRGAVQARRSAEKWRNRLGLPNRFFLASGRFVAEENLPRLLEAYAGYRRRSGAAAWHLVLLGDGEWRAEVASRVAKGDLAGRVILPGFKQYDELPFYYGLAGAFVLASISEPWGLVVNEAMASGLPVIVSNRCGCAHD